MPAPMKIRRSMLLVPAGDERKIAKARAAGADVLMFDLQDSVPFDDVAKRRARDTLRAQLAQRDPDQREVNVRVNAIDSPWLIADLEMVLETGVDSVTFAELRSAGDVIHFERLLASLRPGLAVPEVLLDVETPAALCDLEAIARAATLVTGLMVGVNDYALEVHSSGALFGQRGEPSQDHLTWIRPKTVAVARAHGWTVCDAAMLKDPRDLEAGRAAMALSKRMGFDGWVVLFPPQTGVANEVFSPSAEEIAWASEVVARYATEQAHPAAERVATVPRQHLQLARYMVAQAAAIARPAQRAAG
ncbi:MAG: HpcH/HpaI aldolase/citrate lyase family protein [Burkholderiales bacterium]